MTLVSARLRRSILIVTALGLWGATPAAGQAEDQPVPRIGGHTFVMPALARSPFVRTSVRNAIGLGSASDLDYGTVVLPEGDTLVALQGSITVATLQFAYEHQLRPWLSAWGEFEVGARTGTEATSLLSSGVTYGTSFELGWLIRLRQSTRSMLSLSASVGTQSVTFVDLPGWIEGIVVGDQQALVRSVPAYRVSTGLHYAWVLNDVFAVLGTVSGALGEAVRVREQKVFVAAGVGVSVNLADRYDVPLGFSLMGRVDGGVRLDDVGDTEETGWQGGALRVAYMGRDDIQLSLTFTGRSVPFQDGQSMLVRDAAFGIHYFF